MASKAGALFSLPEPDYGHWLRLGTWTLPEATYLLLGVAPEILEKEWRSQNKYPDDPPPHLREQIGKLSTQLRRGPYCLFDEKEPSAILQWATERKIVFPEQLMRAAEELVLLNKPCSAAKTKKTHKNAQRYSGEREQILGAALCVLANHFKECTSKKGGKVMAAKMARILELNAAIFWKGQATAPQSTTKIEALIKEFINISQKNPLRLPPH